MFIVKVTDNGADPSQIINIFKLEQNTNKNFRSIEVASASAFSRSTAYDIRFIPFEAKKYGVKSYLVRIPKPLVPGEYGMTVEGYRITFNMFGVE